MGRPPPSKIYRVGELNRRVRLKVERWGEVWVEGELSDTSRSPSGHLYFTLDDGREPAQLKGVMFRGDARFCRAKMRDGERVRVLGRFSVYEPRGALQIVARVALTAGEGDRREQLERLKKKLAAEGLFAVERKRSLPRFPSVVGVVTSRRGAAMHDVARVAAGRAPVRLVVSHCQVQGPQAPVSIVRAIRRVCRVRGLEVLILTRGGGASDDLSAFDDERVARAIAGCPVPVVSGVGHEVDLTIADLVADVRAATPSNAAELVVPDEAALRMEIDGHRRHLEQALGMRLGRHRLALERLQRRLSDPRRALGGVRQRFSSVTAALHRGAARALTEDRRRLEALKRRLGRRDPTAALARDRAHFEALRARLVRAAVPALDEQRRRIDGARARLAAAVGPALGSERHRAQRLDAALRSSARLLSAGERQRLERLSARLEALSPLQVLGRGYAIALSESTGRAVLRSRDVAVGQSLRLRLHEGELRVQIQAVMDAEEGS